MIAAIQAGADGYVTKDRGMAEVLAVVRAAAAGDALLAPDLIAEIARRVAESATLEGDRRAIEGLPLRALQVLRLLSTGERT